MTLRRAGHWLTVGLTLGLILVPTVSTAARRALRALLTAALRLRAQPLDPLAPRGLLLVVAPHPDDETLGCGGLIALRRAAGLPVAIAFVTDGSASHLGHPRVAPAALATLRAAEARAATTRLGVPAENVYFLGARDGALALLAATERTALVEKISALLRTLTPAALALPCRHDGSAEHDATFRLVADALLCAGQQPARLEFPVWSWWNPGLLLRPLLRARSIRRLTITAVRPAKIAALACYRTQTEPLPPDRMPVLSAAYVRAFHGADEFFFTA